MFCIKCSKPRTIGRRICDSCNKQRLIELVKDKPRWMSINRCFVCRDEFTAWEKSQRNCRNCSKLVVEVSQKFQSSNNYNMIGEVPEHRIIAERLLGRQLSSDEAIHHIDINSRNNCHSNLSVMSLATHGRLHLFLNKWFLQKI